jgi:hypothetical protein
MGRHVSHEYQVRNTFVEIPIPEEDFVRGRHALSADQAGHSVPSEQAPLDSSLNKGRLDEYLAARTPSPMMHPAQDPTDLMMQMQHLPGCGYAPGAGNLIAFGDLPPDFELTGFDTGDAQCNFAGGMTYDPNSGMYMPYDWSMQFGADGNMCYPMMGGLEGGVDEFGNCLSMMPDGGHTEQLLAALSEKLSAGRDNGMGQPGLADCQDGSVIHPDITFGETLVPSSDAHGMDGSGQHVMGSEMAENMDWNSMEMQVPQPRSEGERGGRKSRNRDRGERGGRGGGQELSGSQQATDNNESEAVQHQGPVNFTTVMFRNIPNKYTREMLVKQLESELKGHFDFVYLPIDFKNQCNVGYAFINFRSPEACEIFLQSFNGVEVRKCLPGLNSRKVTEVTPARVQGFEDNVQRLRNSPVMRELAHHPEWMPLIFDENGVQIPFPAPERPLEPIKPRRRRDEALAGAGA